MQAIYGTLTRTAIHTVKPDNVATFLGRKLHPLYQGEVGSRFNTRIEGTRIKHTMGWVSIKMYDKFGLILRIETTINDVSFFRHYRTVEQRNGIPVTKWAAMKKSIYSLPALREALQAANRRYLEFISTLDDPSAGIDRLQKFYRIVLCILPDVGVQTFEQEPRAIIPTPSQIKSEFFQTLNAVRNLRKTSCLHLVFEAEPSIIGAGP